MKFSEFCSIVYPILKCICRNQCELFDFLVLNCLDDSQVKLSDEISRLSTKSKKSLVTGKTSFGHVASKVYGHFDDTEFQTRIDDAITVDSMVSLLPKLQLTIPDITENNFSEKLGDKLCDIFRDEAASYRNKKHLEEVEKDNVDIGLVTISIDVELIAAIRKLLESSSGNITKTSLNVLRIDKKIDKINNALLSKKVKSYVSEYFPSLNGFFHDEDGNGKKSFEKLAATMRAIYLDINEKTTKKEEVFDSLVNIVKETTGCSRIVAEVIVSYFIQDCEVFDEISE